jgi:hypothetical protein
LNHPQVVFANRGRLNFYRGNFQKTRRFTPAGFSVTFAIMSEQPDDELKLLARAFDRAWKRYYWPGRIGAISADVARPALAKRLIALAKEGVVSVDALAESGLLHLVSLTPEAQHWGHLRIEGAGAKFQQQEWRVRFTFKAVRETIVGSAGGARGSEGPP